MGIQAGTGRMGQGIGQDQVRYGARQSRAGQNRAGFRTAISFADLLASCGSVYSTKASVLVGGRTRRANCPELPNSSTRSSSLVL